MIIGKCHKLAAFYHLQIRQSYSCTVKSCLLLQCFRNNPRNKKEAKAAARKIKTIASRLVRFIGNWKLFVAAHYEQLTGIFF